MDLQEVSWKVPILTADWAGQKAGSLYARQPYYWEKARLPVYWVDAHYFEATITFLKLRANNKRAHLIVTDERGLSYALFMHDMLDIIKRVGIQKGGVISGRWKFRKFGQSFGIRLAE